MITPGSQKPGVCFALHLNKFLCKRRSVITSAPINSICNHGDDHVMTIEAIEELLPQLFRMTGSKDAVAAARAAADRLLDLLDAIVEYERIIEGY